LWLIGRIVFGLIYFEADLYSCNKLHPSACILHCSCTLSSLLAIFDSAISM
jgi:hypothetical protein